MNRERGAGATNPPVYICRVSTSPELSDHVSGRCTVYPHNSALQSGGMCRWSGREGGWGKGGVERGGRESGGRESGGE